MLDLEAQHAPLLDELQRAAARVIASGKFLLGEEVAAFEQAVASASGVAHAVGVSSGTDALLAMLMACGVGPGRRGRDDAVLVLRDRRRDRASRRAAHSSPTSTPTTMNLDPDAAAGRIGRRTKAVLVVHLFGRVARVARPGGRLPAGRHPAARGRGAGDRRLARGPRRAPPGRARSAAAARVSFFPSKNLGGFGDGGMVITDDAELAARVRLLRNQGAARKLVHTEVGGNFRLDELQAALLRVKLPHLAAWTAERVRIAAFYRERLARPSDRASAGRRRVRLESVRGPACPRSGATPSPSRCASTGVATRHLLSRFRFISSRRSPRSGIGAVSFRSAELAAAGGAGAADLSGSRRSACGAGRRRRSTACFR